MQKGEIRTLICLLGLTAGLAIVGFAPTCAAEDGRRLGPLTKLAIKKGIITRHELELEDAVFEPKQLPKGAPVRYLGGIVTSLLIKKKIVTQDELIEEIKIAIKKGEVGREGSPLVSLLVRKNVITNDEAKKVLKALGIKPPPKPAPVVKEEPKAPVEERPAPEQQVAPAEPETGEPEQTGPE